MQNKSFFKLILGSNEFLIPTDFNSLSDVDQNVYSSLIKNHQYTIKSSVSKEVLQSFINNWVNNEIPDINSENISSYSQLSEEFDRMKDLVQIFQNISPKSDFSSLLTKNSGLKKTLSAKKLELSEHIKIYDHKNFLLFSNPSNQLYTKLHEHIWSYDIKKKDCSTYFVELLSKSGIELLNGLIFTYNFNEKTAGLLHYLDQQINVFVPRTITIDSNEYFITNIQPFCFDYESGLRSIEFPEDSKLQIIGKWSFFNTGLERISFPSSLTKIKYHAFKYCDGIKSIEFSDKIDSITFEKKSFQYFGKIPISIKANSVIIKEKAFENSKVTQFSIDAKKVEIGQLAFYLSKKIKKLTISEETQNLEISKEAFGGSSIECVSILAKNSFIENNAFSGCSKLDQIEFSDKSESLTIDTFAFASTSVASVLFPSKKTQLLEHCFRSCGNLRLVEFKGEFVSINSCSFADTLVQFISIDSPNIELNDGWCFSTGKLIDINISNNSNFKFYKMELLFEKSNPENDKYDALTFAKRDIVNVQVPSFIRKIRDNAFNSCGSIQKVEFLPNSELEIVDSYSFSFSSVRSITFPPSVKEIRKLAFLNCGNLESIQFCENSKLNVIEDDAFNDSSLRSLSIPSSISHLGAEFCSCIQYLTDIKVIQNDQKNIQFFDNNFIIGKSDLKSDIYDILYFARRDIQYNSIPSFIKVIGQYAFQFCEYLKMSDISADSQLEKIENYAFSTSSLRQFFVPKSLTYVGEDAFDQCDNLVIVEFDENWNSSSLNTQWFNGSSLVFVMIPAKLRNNLDNLPAYKKIIDHDNNGDSSDGDAGFDLFG